MSDNEHSLSRDAMVAISYNAGGKSPVVAYLLWFFLGSVGAHRFYMGRVASAVVMIALGLSVPITFAVAWFSSGFALWVTGLAVAVLTVWYFVDAVLLIGWVRGSNSRLARRLGITTLL